MRRRAWALPQAPLDLQSIFAGGAAPGNDTRQWVSVGLVTADQGDVVQFRTDLGQPMVSVTLQPSLTPVYCRVGGAIAGKGEGEWHPYVEGDEVLVVLPEGYEDAGAVIIARLSNSLDTFPMDSVAGQDPTTNAFAFRRRRTPFVEEVAGPIVMRSALSGALFSIDEAGHVTIKDSENSALQIGADLIGFAGPSSPDKSPEFLLQLDLTHRHFNLQIGDAVMCLSASDATPEQNTITVPGPMTIGTLGNAPLEHVATTESVANVLEKVFVTFAALVSPVVVPLTGAALATLIGTWMSTGPFAAAWIAAASAPLGAAAPTLPAVLAGLFAAPIQKPNTGGFQTSPGIGSAGLLVG